VNIFQNVCLFGLHAAVDVRR